MRAEKHLRIDQDRYVILRIQGTDPFGGYTARSIGAGFEYGSTGTTYGDPRSNMSAQVNISIWRWALSVTACWKGPE